MLYNNQTIENFKEEIEKVKTEFKAGFTCYNWKWVDKRIDIQDMKTYFITNHMQAVRIHFDETLKIIRIDRMNVHDIDVLRDMSKML